MNRRAIKAAGRGISVEEAYQEIAASIAAHRLGTPEVTVFSADDFQSVPRPTDPWSALRDVPGVVVDRVNVGGSDTALQSLLVSHGDAGSGAVWTIDGFDVTDPAALGSTSVFPDMDALEGLDPLP